MKKHKILHRCYLGGYFLWAFGVIMCPLLLIKISNILALIMFILAALILAGLITSHVYYNTKREWYPLVSFISHGAASLFVLAAFVIEMIYVGIGKGGVYAMIITPFCLAMYALLDFYLVRANLKIMKDIKKEAESK